MKKQQTPFSARTRDANKAAPVGFPETARRGLLHSIDGLIRRGCVSGWDDVARELRRIARVSPIELESYSALPQQSDALLMALPWERAIDFCERLHDHLSKGVYDHDEGRYVVTPESAKQFIAEELQRLFQEEGLPFEMRDGCVHRRGRRHSVEMIAQAQVVLGDPRLVGARRHYRKAREFFENPRTPDYENCVKEAVCAVEAAGKALFPAARASTLDELLKWLTSDQRGLIPKTVAKSVGGLYAFRGGGEGVVHGGAGGGTPTAGVAEFAMAVCASSIILLVDVSAEHDEDIPF